MDEWGWGKGDLGQYFTPEAGLQIAVNELEA